MSTELDDARENARRAHDEYDAARARLDAAEASLDAVRQEAADLRGRLDDAQAALPSGGRVSEASWGKAHGALEVHAAKVQACEAALGAPRAGLEAANRAWGAATAHVNALVAAGIEADYTEALERYENTLRAANEVLLVAQVLRERYAATAGRQLPIIPVALHLRQRARERAATIGGAA